LGRSFVQKERGEGEGERKKRGREGEGGGQGEGEAGKSVSFIGKSLDSSIYNGCKFIPRHRFL